MRRHCFFLPPRAFSSGFALARVTWARGERPLPRSFPPLPADKRVQMSRAARVSAPPISTGVRLISSLAAHYHPGPLP